MNIKSLVLWSNQPRRLARPCQVHLQEVDSWRPISNTFAIQVITNKLALSSRKFFSFLVHFTHKHTHDRLPVLIPGNKMNSRRRRKHEACGSEIVIFFPLGLGLMQNQFLNFPQPWWVCVCVLTINCSLKEEIKMLKMWMTLNSHSS